MDRTIRQLELRGYVIDGVEKNYLYLSTEHRIGLLKSNLPFERTLGARLLSDCTEVFVIDYLVKALVGEKKLYPKIEICISLVTFGKDSVKPLILLLGKIGNNQYREIPEKVFEKKNYPLPRDIAARTLIRIGHPALPDLLKCLRSDDLRMLSEAIDAIGFICFYKWHSKSYISLIECFNKRHINDLIRWKIFRSMSAFPESENFLNEQKLLTDNSYMKSEIDRSLRLIKNRL